MSARGRAGRDVRGDGEAAPAYGRGGRGQRHGRLGIGSLRPRHGAGRGGGASAGACGVAGVAAIVIGALLAALFTAAARAAPAPAAPATAATSALAGAPAATGAAAAASGWGEGRGAVLVMKDGVALRGAPRESAPQLATLWQGEALEVRGERHDFVQVWDYGRERGGYVRASALHRLSTRPADAPALFAVLRFVRDTPGAEALGIGIAAAWLRAAPADAVRGPAGVEAFDALGGFADRLAQRATAGVAGNRAAEERIAAHLDVARRYGVAFASFERDGRVQVCYDGEAFRRVLGAAAGQAAPAEQARAALGLTRPDCVDPKLGVAERGTVDAWRAGVLDRIDLAAAAGDGGAALPPSLRNRVAMQRAGVWSAIAFCKARQGEPAQATAERALADFARIVPAELGDDDQPAYNDAAMRVNAARWAAQPQAIVASPSPRRGVAVRTVPGEPGQTCVELVDDRGDGAAAAAPLARRCTYALVAAASANVNREGNAVALAVQPAEAWRELWLFRKRAGAWSVDVVPPATVMPGIGYAEFAGWVPGGQQVLVAREARGEGRYKRSFEVLRLDGLAVERQSGDPAALGPFQRWPDPAWKRDSLAQR